MRNVLINVLATALMVCVATVSSVTFGALMILFTQTPAESLAAADAGTMVFGGFAGGVMAAVVGVFFCIVTLFWAALTLPPSLWLIRSFDLPRPAMDVIGGGLVGLLCATIGIAAFDEIKGADVIRATGEQILATVGLAAGCLLGFVRHALLVRGREPSEQGLASAA